MIHSKVKKSIKRVSLVLVIVLTSFASQSDFLTEQKKYARVRTAISEKEDVLKKELTAQGLNLQNFHMLVMAYKQSNEFEVYVKKKTETVYKKLKTYSICQSSGILGPKRKQGDLQVPEGFYHIDRFNPVSSFYLSLGINYPNLSDKRKSQATNLGGDIFIHGSCVTIGCMPMTDDKIKEIYVYAVNAKNNGQSKIPVYIFPYRMIDETHAAFKLKYHDQKDLILFWDNLKVGYDKFKETNKELTVKINSDGAYYF